MRQMQASSRRDRGFTLIELVVVMTIITILAGAVTLQVMNRIEHGKRARALMDVKTIEDAVDMYAADNGQPPTTQQGIAALRTKPSAPPVPKNWNGPYLKKKPMDPWGNEYVYRSPGQLTPEYDIVCYGKDGQPGGSGEFDKDISNAEE